MSTMVTKVCVRFNYDRLCIDKALGNWKSDNNNKKKKDNVHGAWGSFSGPKTDINILQGSVAHLNRLL